MPDYGLLPTGFIPKQLSAILEDMNGALSQITDPVTGEYPFQNATDDSVLQQVVGVFASECAVCWGMLGEVFLQFDPLMNTGAGQSGTVQINGITRKPGTPTRASFLLTGIAGTTVPAGSIICDATGSLQFVTEEPVTLEGTGNSATGSVTGICSSTGPVDPEVGEINIIQTPLPGGGWFGATNTATLVVGTSQESDEELRARQQVSTSLTSYRQIEAIYAAVRNLEGVTYCRAYQNSDTQPADERGIPYKEVGVVVEGGDEQSIAEALFLRFPISVLGYGSITRNCYDTLGTQYAISFSRPVGVPIYVKIVLVLTNRAAYPDNGIDLIKEAIIEYAQYNGALAIGFPPGEDIVLSRLYTPINSISGFSVKSLQIGLSDSTLGEVDIPIAWDHVGRFYPENIDITFVDA